MPRHVITGAQVTLNGVDVSRRVKKVTIRTSKRPPANVSAMQDAWEENILVDIKAFKASIDFYQDYTSGAVWPTIQGVFAATGSSGVALIVRVSTALRTSDVPEWQGQVLLDGEFPQIDGEFGATHMASLNLLGTGALAFVTSSSS